MDSRCGPGEHRHAGFDYCHPVARQHGREIAREQSAISNPAERMRSLQRDLVKPHDRRPTVKRKMLPEQTTYVVRAGSDASMVGKQDAGGDAEGGPGRGPMVAGKVHVPAVGAPKRVEPSFHKAEQFAEVVKEVIEYFSIPKFEEKGYASTTGWPSGGSSPPGTRTGSPPTGVGYQSLPHSADRISASRDRFEFYQLALQTLTRALVAGPIGAEDMNAGEQVVQEPAPESPRSFTQTWDSLPSEVSKSAVPQGYLPEYGSVRVLYKSEGPKEDYTGREIVVAGYASPQVIDRERHLILKEAMAKDLPRFLAEPKYANAMILHSNVQVGEVLKEWTHPETGETYRTEVDDIGLFVVVRIRTDPHRPKIVDKVIDDILAGKLKAFSISGDAPVESRKYVCADGTCFWVIPEIEFYEITICEEGVNQDAKFMILSKACSDGCGIDKQESRQSLTEDRIGTEDAVRGKVEEIAERVGEDAAIRMLEDVMDAHKKLGKVAGEVGATGSGDQATMQDFAKPYSTTDKSASSDSFEIDRWVKLYEDYLNAGASPEDAYFKILQDGDDGTAAPHWFGTRSEAFRRWLVAVYQKNLPIPAVRLRVAGTREGEIIADPLMTAWDLLQTAIGSGSAGFKLPAVKAQPPRDLSLPLPDWAGPYWREEREPDEGERYYLNLRDLPSRTKSPSILPRPRQLDEFEFVHENVARAAPRSPAAPSGPGGAGTSYGRHGLWTGGVGGRASIGRRAGQREGHLEVPQPGKVKFARAVIESLRKDFPFGVRARDYLLDPKQQHDLPSERGARAVQSGGSRFDKQEAATEIIYPDRRVAPMSGRKVTEPLDTVLQPPPGVTRTSPEQGILTTNEGVSLSPLADLDTRGAYRNRRQ